jgi:hypothetical protein
MGRNIVDIIKNLLPDRQKKIKKRSDDVIKSMNTHWPIDGDTYTINFEVIYNRDKIIDYNSLPKEVINCLCEDFSMTELFFRPYDLPMKSGKYVGIFQFFENSYPSEKEAGYMDYYFHLIKFSKL